MESFKARRKASIKKFCDIIGSPSLIWAFDDPLNGNIDLEFMKDFRRELINTLTAVSTGKELQLPNNINPNGLPAFVAVEKVPGGAIALYRLGYRPGWESPLLIDEKYEVKFFMPNKTSITFRTGPDGGFSVYSLWLEMRILCGKNKDARLSYDNKTEIVSDSKAKPDTSSVFTSNSSSSKPDISSMFGSNTSSSATPEGCPVQ